MLPQRPQARDGPSGLAPNGPIYCDVDFPRLATGFAPGQDGALEPRNPQRGATSRFRARLYLIDALLNAGRRSGARTGRTHPAPRRLAARPQRR